MEKVSYSAIVGEEAFDAESIEFSGNNFSLSAAVRAFDRHGLVVIHGDDSFARAQLEFDEAYRQIAPGRTIDKFNGVNFGIGEETPQAVLAVEAYAPVLDLVRRIILRGSTIADVGILSSKFIVKDAAFRGSVFLHQDSCYQLGNAKVTAFFLLSDLRSGALRASTIRALVGTHHFGHLGDAGEIDRSILEDDWPELEFAYDRHSFILMHPSIWHHSHEAALDEVRGVYTYTFVEDGPLCQRFPGDKEIRNDNGFTRGVIFNRSRASRLKEIQQELDALKAT